MKSLVKTDDFKDIREIVLKVGNSCNMRCRHCSQTNERRNELPINVTENTMLFLENYIRFCINIQENPAKMRKLLFYGGEILLYWDLVRPIIKNLSEKYDLLSHNNFCFAITTNGLGITKEIVDFINQYNVRVSFSYDAPYPFAVRGYVSDDICNLVNKIKNLTIISSGSSYNCDPLLAHLCLKEKFPNAKQSIRMEVFRVFDEMDSDIDAYNVKEINDSVKKLFIAMRLGDAFAKNYINDRMEETVFFGNSVAYSKNVGLCSPGYRRLAVTLDGEICFCLNSSIVLGTVNDTLDEIVEKGCKCWNRLFGNKCDSCEYKGFCVDICAFFAKDKWGNVINCEKFKKPYFRAFLKELKKIKEPLSINEIAWYKEQEALMAVQVKKFLAEGRHKYEQGT